MLWCVSIAQSVHFIQLSKPLLSKLNVVMYATTTFRRLGAKGSYLPPLAPRRRFYALGFILDVESMAKTVIKGTISQLSLGNSFSQTIGNPFHNLHIYWHLPFCVNTYYISCTSAYTTCWRDGELKLQMMMGHTVVNDFRWFPSQFSTNYHEIVIEPCCIALL